MEASEWTYLFRSFADCPRETGGQVSGHSGLARRRNQQLRMTNPRNCKSALFDNEPLFFIKLHFLIIILLSGLYSIVVCSV